MYIHIFYVYIYLYTILYIDTYIIYKPSCRISTRVYNFVRSRGPARFDDTSCMRDSIYKWWCVRARPPPAPYNARECASVCVARLAVCVAACQRILVYWSRTVGHLAFSHAISHLPHSLALISLYILPHPIQRTASGVEVVVVVLLLLLLLLLACPSPPPSSHRRPTPRALYSLLLFTFLFFFILFFSPSALRDNSFVSGMYIRYIFTFHPHSSSKPSMYPPLHCRSLALIFFLTHPFFPKRKKNK